jgi:hypothetical protein
MSEPLTSEHVRRLLRTAHPEAPRVVDLEVVRRGGRRLRRRNLYTRGAGTALAAALVVFAVSALHGNAAHDHVAAATFPTAAASTHPTPNGSVHPRSQGPSPVVIVVAGQRIPIDTGTDLWLTPTSKCQGIPGAPSGNTAGECHSATSGNQGRGSVSLQAQGGVSQHTVFSGIYTGADAATILITDTQTGQDQTATIVQLAGSHTWVAYYAIGPFQKPRTIGPSSTAAREVTSVVVLDAQGRTLAHLP